MLIRDKIREYIEYQRKKGQYRLPPERELAGTFNCSRLAVSNAMSYFEAHGLVVRRQGSGTYIHENSPEARSFNIGIGLRRPYYTNEQHFTKLMRCLGQSAK